MFARSVSFQLKPGQSTEFARILDTDVIPALRRQQGFQDEIAFVAPGGVDVVAISMWDLKENAEIYARRAYSGVLTALEPVLDGTPRVQGYEVSNSTFHKVTVPVTV
jgi:hypothetical protein